MSCDIKLNLINKINSFNNVIREVTIYEAVCDGCGKWITTQISRTYLINIILNHYGWLQINHETYCPDCYEYDEETDDYKPKKKED